MRPPRPAPHGAFIVCPAGPAELRLQRSFVDLVVLLDVDRTPDLRLRQAVITGQRGRGRQLVPGRVLTALDRRPKLVGRRMP